MGQVPVGLPTEGPLAEMLGVAHDGLRVPLALLPCLPKLQPAVTAALGDMHAENGGSDGDDARADGDG